ncbi:unnamed protein product [Orchesella dallaii]|uniref:Secreted protein n=1 Tax=Orchesella dallaii TaxID=48710 RepID=A0ABP1QMF6_9HEXA
MVQGVCAYLSLSLSFSLSFILDSGVEDKRKEEDRVTLHFCQSTMSLPFSTAVVFTIKSLNSITSQKRVKERSQL